MIKKIILSMVLILSFQASYADDDTYVYHLKYSSRYGDVVVYCGMTKNPERRAHEHVRDDTLSINTFDTMVVFAGPMSRAEARQGEINCIQRYDIPYLYQTFPGDIRTQEQRQRAIDRYESRYAGSTFTQIEDPAVEYTPGVQRAIRNMGAGSSGSSSDEESSSDEDSQPTCDFCGAAVTNGVENYSRNHFGGNVFCMPCQSQVRTFQAINNMMAHRRR